LIQLSIKPLIPAASDPPDWARDTRAPNCWPSNLSEVCGCAKRQLSFF
jgi:hypothetical protein